MTPTSAKQTAREKGGERAKSTVVIKAATLTCVLKMRLFLSIPFVAIVYLRAANAFVNDLNWSSRRRSIDLRAHSADDDADDSHRRATLAQLAGSTMTLTALITGFPSSSAMAADAPAFVQEYEDFSKTSEGWSFRDVKVGEGESPNWGDRVVFSWSGYTIGYFGRPFEAKGGPQGGAFDKDVDFSRTVLGSGQMVKGLECAMTSMKPGGVRQVLVPYGELGYPGDDLPHDRVGPKPSTFSGQRALNFVLENPRVDRTLLFNVKLVRVDKPDGKGGFRRGDKRS